MSEHHATIHIDGAARGNPGPAAYAFVLRRSGQPDHEESHTLGRATNNVAEYTALVRALERAAELKLRTLEVFSDSELLVKQMNGEYRVKHPDLLELYQEAKELQKQFERVTLMHVRRANNADADRLCNEALDGEARAKPSKPPARPPLVEQLENPAPPRVHGGAPEQLEVEALALLNAVELVWRAQQADAPTAVDVWDQLWHLINEHGVLKKRKA